MPEKKENAEQEQAVKSNRKNKRLQRKGKLQRQLGDN